MLLFSWQILFKIVVAIAQCIGSVLGFLKVA